MAGSFHLHNAAHATPRFDIYHSRFLLRLAALRIFSRIPKARGDDGEWTGRKEIGKHFSDIFPNTAPVNLTARNQDTKERPPSLRPLARARPSSVIHTDSGPE